MKLISDKEIEDAAKEWSSGFNSQQDAIEFDFKSGVFFAEQKLMPLFVELLDFSSTQYVGVDGIFSAVSNKEGIDGWIDSQQLLELFILNRNK